jgi:hypothetical protein
VDEAKPFDIPKRESGRPTGRSCGRHSKGGDWSSCEMGCRVQKAVDALCFAAKSSGTASTAKFSPG